MAQLFYALTPCTFFTFSLRLLHMEGVKKMQSAEPGFSSESPPR